MGCTLNCDPSWAQRLLPARIPSMATRALSFALYCFLIVVINRSFIHDSRRKS